jgi:uncharacterized caspase-like protein
MPLADRALVVGINRYPKIGQLSGAQNDADAFYEWVTDPAGGSVAKANALRLRSADFAAPPDPDNEQPDKVLVEKFFTGIDNSANANNLEGLGLKAGNRLWLFFSGHGFAPSLDRSGVLMANATSDRVHNVAAMLWANRLYDGGWFDDVLLFQDACRSRIGDAELTPPFIKARQAPIAQVRRRFYAFSAKNRQLSKELPLDGAVHGVFTYTLLQGLRGQARDPQTGAVTTAQLKGYLQANMRKLLPQADLDDDEIAKMPEVYDPDPFDIVPAPAVPAVPDFPVRIIGAAGPGARVVDATLRDVVVANPAPDPWSVRLQRGFFKVICGDGRQTLFEVTGATMGGIAGEFDVHL